MFREVKSDRVAGRRIERITGELGEGKHESLDTASVARQFRAKAYSPE